MKKIPIYFKIPYPFIKWAAIFFMTYDHALRTIFNFKSGELVLVPGRFAFPLFIFMIVWNIAHKSIIIKYIKRMLPFAIAASIIDYTYSEVFPLNVLFSFILSLMMIHLLERCNDIKRRNIRYVLMFVIMGIFSLLSFYFDYEIRGLWTMFFLYHFFKTRNALLYIITIVLMTFLSISIVAKFCILIIATFLLLAEPVASVKRSSFKKTGWLFYLYFPLHKLIIELIAKYL